MSVSTGAFSSSVGAAGDERALYARAQRLRTDPVIAAGDHAPDHAVAQRRLEGEQLTGRQPLQRLAGAEDLAELLCDAPEMVELRPFERRVQQRLVVELELDTPVGQPFECRAGARARLLQRHQPVAV